MVLPPRYGLSLCAGGGGLDMGLDLAEPGFATACYVEWEEHPRATIIAAQRAGYFKPAPIWDNVKTFDGRPWRGICDTVLAGYPCQPFSAAGQRKGENDPRHLWPDVSRIIGEVQPEWVFLENVPGHVSLGLETVLRTLWQMDYTPAVGLFSAAETGAPHERLRMFIVAHRSQARRQGAERQNTNIQPCQGGTALDHSTSPRRDAARIGAEADSKGGQRMSGNGCDDVGNAAGIGRGEGRAEPIIRGGRDTAASTSGALADSIINARHKGRRGPECNSETGTYGQADRPCSPKPSIYPPGPSDSAAWAETLATAPDLAPATGLADCLAWASRLAQAMEKPGQSPAQSRLCGMADGLATRSRQLRLLGNGVVPLAAGYAWRTLSAAHGLRPVDMDAAT